MELLATPHNVLKWWDSVKVSNRHLCNFMLINISVEIHVIPNRPSLKILEKPRTFAIKLLNMLLSWSGTPHPENI